MHDLLTQTEKIFSPQGVLSRRLAGYEARSGQLDMALAVARCLAATTGDHSGPDSSLLAVEAETGIGKTLAYLIPAALSGRRVIISTGTLNLQEQILHKEIPFIKDHVDPDLAAICVKGRQNYLCLYRWRQMYHSDQLSLFENEQIDAVAQWLSSTTTGDRAELEWLPDNSGFWRQISASSSQCPGTACPDSGECFISQLRKKAARCRLLIVNHHLFFSDLALRRCGFAEVLPRYEAVIFDEAHHIENIATRYFGTSVSHFQLLDLAHDIERMCHEDGTQRKYDKVIAAARGMEISANRFLALFPDDKGRFPLHEAVAKIANWDDESFLLNESLRKLLLTIDPLGQQNELWNAMHRRISELLANLNSVVEKHDSSHVYWYERREKTVILSASPIEIAGDLRQALYHEVKSAVFTSATLTAGGSFSYFFERLGLPDATDSLRLASPFDYKGRTRLFIPDRFPEPASPLFLPELQERVLDLLLASQGRALVLFTSFKAMHALHGFLADRLPFPLFIQGSAQKQALLDRFSRETHSVLLAVASFWEGVDVPGPALSCVIIDKLPFEVPNDPVIMARIDKIKENGGNPFMDFQVPRAILTLRQGIGRLMRSSTDCGLLAIMDIRLFSKQYGRAFRQSLPNSEIIRSMAEVRSFFDEITGTG